MSRGGAPGEPPPGEEMIDGQAHFGHGEAAVQRWDRYTGNVEIISPYFGSSGTGQINAIFPV